MSTCDTGQVEQRVRDAGAGEDTEEADLLHQLLDGVLHPLEPGQSLRVFEFLLQLVELLLLLTGLGAREPGGPSHEVGWELPNGRARSPAEGLHPDLAEDGPDGDLGGGGDGGLGDVGRLRADDLSWVGRTGELQAAALVGRHGDGGDVRAEVEEEGVEASSQTHRAEDPQPHPPAAPGQVLLPTVEDLLVGSGSVVQAEHHGPEEEGEQHGQPVLGQGKGPVPQVQHQLTQAVPQHQQRTPSKEPLHLLFTL